MFMTGQALAVDLFAGIKLQRRGGVPPIKRMVEEIGTMATIAGKDEIVLRALPRIFGLIVVEDSPLTALLVEDASQGGAYEVSGTDMSPDMRSRIESHVGPANLIDDYRDYMAFMVGEDERILDADPSPFVRAPEQTVQVREAIQKSLADFTVRITPHSPLAIAMQSPPWL